VATAQQSGGTATEPIATLPSRDLSGTLALSEKVVTLRSRPTMRKHVLTETYVPPIEGSSRPNFRIRP
jgi:hypothetical protein